MTAPTPEELFLTRLAAAPDDATVRAEFQAWLADQKDARAEAMAIHARGTLTTAERVTLGGLTRIHGDRWLGPLAALAEESKFDGGVLSHLELKDPPGNRWESLVGEVRLGTVRSLCLRAGLSNPPEGFLAHPVVRNVTRLECNRPTVAMSMACAPSALRVHLFGLGDAAPLQHWSSPAPLRQLALILRVAENDVAALVRLALSCPWTPEQLEVTSLADPLELRVGFLADTTVALRKEPRPGLQRLATRLLRAELSVHAPAFDVVELRVEPEPWGNTQLFDFASTHAHRERLLAWPKALAELAGGGFRRLDLSPLSRGQ